MSSFSKTIISGRLGGEVELKFTTSGKAVANFTVAVDRPGAAGTKETDWYRVVVWEKLAENTAKYLGKGSEALVEGRMECRKYIDSSGTQKTSWELKAQQVNFIGKKLDSPNVLTPPPNTNANTPQEVEHPDDIEDGDIPF